MSISRRGLLLGMTALLAGCSASGGSHRSNYAAIPDEPYPLKAIPFDKIKPDLRRQEVAYDAGYPEGTIVVDTPARRLYYVLGNGRAQGGMADLDANRQHDAPRSAQSSLRRRHVAGPA